LSGINTASAGQESVQHVYNSRDRKQKTPTKNGKSRTNRRIIEYIWPLMIMLFRLLRLDWYWTSLWQAEVVMVFTSFSVSPRTVQLKNWDSFASSLTDST